MEEETIEQKIARFEREGKFDQDVLPDPPTIELKPNKIDYLRTKFFNKLKTKIVNFFAKKYINKLIKTKQLRIKEFRGVDNLKAVNTGAVITCNHCDPFDNFLIQKVFEQVQKKHQKLWKVIREGNYTNPPCFKSFFRNCGTLPLSQNKATMVKFMRAVNTLLERGDLILVYPEESLWPNYRKPKPLKDGAFYFAVKNNVPVVPTFITMNDIVDENGKPAIEYVVNVGEPIYPNMELDKRDRVEDMKNRNYNWWKSVYETYYGTKLTYTTEVGTDNK